MPLLKQGVIRGPADDAYLGWSVTIEERNGAFFIYLIEDPRDPKSEGYDRFALDRDDLQGQLSGWVIEWAD